MNILGIQIVTSNPSVDKRSYNDAAQFLAGEDIGSLPGFSGLVTADTARRSAAVYSCVDIIARTIASLPLITYQRLDGSGRKRATNHPLYRLLNLFPNSWMTRMELFELFMTHLLLRGNAYAFIMRDSIGQVIGLIPMQPDRMQVKLSDQFVLTYKYTKAAGKQEIYTQRDIFHVRGPSDDGLIGKSCLQNARDVIGLGLTLDEYNSKVYQNGTRLGGILEHPSRLNEIVASRISKSFRDAFSGPSNAGKVPLLEDGVKFNPISMTNSDAQFIESRKFQISEIARLFHVPPHMIGDLDKASFSNIEQQSIDFVQHCIRPWLIRLELCVQRDLFSADESTNYFSEFLVDALLRGDFKSRMEGYQIGINTGIMQPNEVRELENRNPLEYGDYTLLPLNSQPVSDQEDLDKLKQTVQSKAGVNKPIDAPKEDEPAEPTDEQKSQLSLVLSRCANSFAPILEELFSRRIKHEQVVFVRSFKTRELYDNRAKEFFNKLPVEIEPEIEPIINGLTEQLRSTADLLLQKSSPLPTEFLSQWVSTYVEDRFQLVWNSEPASIEAILKADSRSTPSVVARNLIQDVIRSVIGEPSCQ